MSNEIQSLSKVAVPKVSAPTPAEPRKSSSEPASGKQVPPAGQVAPTPEEESAELARAVEKLADYARNIGRDLQFEVDSASGRMLIKVIDPETNEVVRQIPSAEAIERARSRNSDDMNLVDDMA